MILLPREVLVPGMPQQALSSTAGPVSKVVPDFSDHDFRRAVSGLVRVYDW